MDFTQYINIHFDFTQTAKCCSSISQLARVIKPEVLLEIVSHIKAETVFMRDVQRLIIDAIAGEIDFELLASYYEKFLDPEDPEADN
jgi:hypothetical protein